MSELTETKEMLFKALPKLRRYLDDIEIYVKAGNYSKASGLVDCVMEQSNLIACCTEDLEFIEE